MALTRLGQVNNTGDTKALFAKLFLTDVIAAYDEYVIFDKLLNSRTIDHGKSASFPVTWKTSAQYFIPGTSGDLLGNNSVGQNEVVINIDSILESDILVPQIDELMLHYDVRGTYATQMGQALARVKDQHLAQLLIKAARDTTTGSASITGGKSAANQISTANMNTDATVIIAGLFSIAQKFSETYVPLEGTTCAMKPAQFYLLAQNTTLQSRFYNNTNFPLTQGVLPDIAGFPIVKSNNLPNGSNLGTTADAGTANNYNADFTKSVGIVFNKNAVSTLNLLGMTTEQQWIPWKQATLLIAKMACGHGITRPEAAYELVFP